MKYVNALYEWYLTAVEYRAEMGQYTIAAIMTVFGFLVMVVGFFAILWGILIGFGTKAYIAVFVIGAVVYARRNIARAYEQDDDDDDAETETGVS